MITIKFRGTSKNHIYLNEETLGLWSHALDHAIMTCEGKYEEQFLLEMQDYFDELRDIIMQSENPTKYGNWIGTEFDGYADGFPVYYEWKCSECGTVFEDEEPTYNYCPHCGAKMNLD